MIASKHMGPLHGLSDIVAEIHCRRHRRNIHIDGFVSVPLHQMVVNTSGDLPGIVAPVRDKDSCHRVLARADLSANLAAYFVTSKRISALLS
jgi:hypothetical protein